jgi:hypothetical protein
MVNSIQQSSESHRSLQAKLQQSLQRNVGKDMVSYRFFKRADSIPVGIVRKVNGTDSRD